MRLFHVFIVQLLILFGISLILLLLQQICTNLFLHLIEGGYGCVLLILNLTGPTTLPTSAANTA